MSCNVPSLLPLISSSPPQFSCIDFYNTFCTKSIPFPCNPLWWFGCCRGGWILCTMPLVKSFRQKNNSDNHKEQIWSGASSQDVVRLSPSIHSQLHSWSVPATTAFSWSIDWMTFACAYISVMEEHDLFLIFPCWVLVFPDLISCFTAALQNLPHSIEYRRILLLLLLTMPHTVLLTQYY